MATERVDETGTPRVGYGQTVLSAQLDRTATPPSEQLEHLYRLGDPNLSELPLEPLLDELLIRIRDALGVDTAAILLLDESGDGLVPRAAKGIEEETEAGIRIPLGKGFAGRVAAQRTALFIADVEHADVVNPLLRERGLRSLLGVPLVVEGELIGVLHVGTLHSRTFTGDDAGLLQLAAARAAPAIERARLFDALEREHHGAVLLQRSLLPERMPDLVGINVAARYVPARDEVGGDWYDVIALGRGCIGIAIGDVVGHGVRAAALMGHLRTALRAYAVEGHDPAVVLQRVDRLLQATRDRGMATAGYGVLDPATGTLHYASAGHPPPLLTGPDGPRLLDPRSATPLGALPYGRYHEVEFAVGDGETVLLYSDGLVEERGVPVTQGLERLVAAAAGDAAPESLCSRLMRALVPTGGSPDDVALVAVQRAPVPEALHLRLKADPSILAGMRQMVRRWLHKHGASDEDVMLVTLACGEACANAIEHAYPPTPASFELHARHREGEVTITVRDEGRWRQPRGENRGRGLTIMDGAMDGVEVEPGPLGTELRMHRRLRGAG